jgi:hypothetical protein
VFFCVETIRTCKILEEYQKYSVVRFSRWHRKRMLHVRNLSPSVVREALRVCCNWPLS